SIDAQIAETLATHEHTAAFQPIPISADRSISRPNWLARAAAWIGAFHLFGNTAKASTVIVMKKTVTSITAAILILGGSGIYAIHRQNESSKARVDQMETEIQSLSDQLGIQSTTSTRKNSGTGNSRKPVSVTQVSAILNDSKISSHELAQYNEFQEQLAAMDADALKSLLLDAEKISNPIHGRIAEMIMKALIAKDPAMATQIASQLIGRGSEFQFLLSSSAAVAFKAWLAKDSAAASAWYAETAAAGGFIGKNIPPNGLEDQSIDRSFARLRFAALAGSNPSEAAAMLATMLPADVIESLKTVTDPNALRQILPALSPEQKGPAANGVIKAMAMNDIDAALAWANSLGLADRERDTLMAVGIEAAVAGGKLDLAGAAERSRNLDLDAKKRSELLVSAATSVSMIPRKDEHRIEVDNSVYWDRVTERIDWLRKEAPADSADEMVGSYLGGLSYASHNLKKSLEAYETEVSRQGEIDPDLTVAFATRLSIAQDESMKAAALKLLNNLTPSEKRDHAIQMIELNR
ncbi:MAG: hypothetical protein CFE26_16460, partial [Verrucomicrobiales bacterium VVV1]